MSQGSTLRVATHRTYKWLVPVLLPIPIAILVLGSVDRLSVMAGLPGPLSSGQSPQTPTDAAFFEHPIMAVLHIVLGLLIVLLGPMQFIGSIRRRWPAVHRGAGRVFAFAALLTGATGLVMNTVFPSVGLPTVALIYTMGVAQIVTIVVALRAILRRDIPTHRAWMMRAYGVAMSAGHDERTGVLGLRHPRRTE